MIWLRDIVYNFIQVILHLIKLAYLKNTTTFKPIFNIRLMPNIEFIFNIRLRPNLILSALWILMEILYILKLKRSNYLIKINIFYFLNDSNVKALLF